MTPDKKGGGCLWYCACAALSAVMVFAAVSVVRWGVVTASPYSWAFLAIFLCAPPYWIIQRFFGRRDCHYQAWVKAALVTPLVLAILIGAFEWYLNRPTVVYYGVFAEDPPAGVTVLHCMRCDYGFDHEYYLHFTAPPEVIRSIIQARELTLYEEAGWREEMAAIVNTSYNPLTPSWYRPLALINVVQYRRENMATEHGEYMFVDEQTGEVYYRVVYW